MKIKITTTDKPHNPPKPTTFAEWLQASPHRKVEVIRAPDGFKAVYTWTRDGVVGGFGRQSRVWPTAGEAVAELHGILSVVLKSIPQEMGLFAFEQVAADPRDVAREALLQGAARLQGMEEWSRNGALPPPRDAPCSHRFAQVIKGYWRNRLQCPDCGWGRHLERHKR